MVTGSTRRLLPARLLPAVLPDRLHADGVTDANAQTRGNVLTDRARARVNRACRVEQAPPCVQAEQRCEIRADGYGGHRPRGSRLARNTRETSYHGAHGNGTQI